MFVRLVVALVTAGVAAQTALASPITPGDINPGASLLILTFDEFPNATFLSDEFLADGSVQLVLELRLADGGTVSIPIAHTMTETPGNVFYFGVLSDDPFVRTTLRNVGATGGDAIGFDDFTIAIIPEPGTLFFSPARSLSWPRADDGYDVDACADAPDAVNPSGGGAGAALARRWLEHETGLEPATPTLATWRSTN